MKIPTGAPATRFLRITSSKGEIKGLDVAGLNYVEVVKIPGNVLAPHRWKRVSYVDARATEEQRTAILDAWHGRLGGPLADLNGLVGEDVAIETAPIEHNLKDGEGTLAVGDKLRATMAPYRSAYGAITTLRDSHLQHHPRRAGVYREGLRTRRQHPRTRNGVDV